METEIASQEIQERETMHGKCQGEIIVVALHQVFFVDSGSLHECSQQIRPKKGQARGPRLFVPTVTYEGDMHLNVLSMILLDGFQISKLESFFSVQTNS